MGKKTLTNFSYDRLGGGRYRVRLVDDKGKTRKGLLRKEQSIEIEVSVDARWSEVKTRIEQAARELEG